MSPSCARVGLGSKYEMVAYASAERVKELATRKAVESPRFGSRTGALSCAEYLQPNYVSDHLYNAVLVPGHFEKVGHSRFHEDQRGVCGRRPVLRLLPRGSRGVISAIV
jgi:hypothetical protein